MSDAMAPDWRKVYRHVYNCEHWLNVLCKYANDYGKEIEDYYHHDEYSGAIITLREALQLSYQYAMMKAALSATGSSGVCTKYQAYFIDEAFISKSTAVQFYHKTLSGREHDKGWMYFFSYQDYIMKLPAFAEKRFAFVEEYVPPRVKSLAKYSGKVNKDYLSCFIELTDDIFELFSKASPRNYRVEKMVNGKKITTLKYEIFDDYVAAFDKIDREIFDRCHKAFNDIFVVPWKQGSKGL